MGFSKWIIKNGPGGVGWMTKYWTKQYLSLYHPMNISLEEKLEFYVLNFQEVQRLSNNIAQVTDSEDIVQYCENCMATLFFCMMCDTKGFVKQINVGNEVLQSVLEVIYELVRELAPNTIKFNYTDYRIKCVIYLENFRYI